MVMRKQFLILRLCVVALFLLQYYCAKAQPVAVPAFDGESAFGYLEKQCGFGPRNPGSEGHTQCLEFISIEMKRYSPDVRLQPFWPSGGLTGDAGKMSNIIAHFHAPRSSLKPLLLCAHWDTRPVADRDPDPKNRNTPIPGANDGASGVAVLLEISRTMKDNPPPRPVTIVFFDGEDGGREGELDTWCLGSKHFAAGLTGSEYSLAILLDMIGDRDLSIPKEGYSVQVAQDRMNDIWRRAARLGITAFKNRTGTYVYDDHIPLIQAGIPAIDLIDFDYPYWHTLQDTPDKCSPESLAAVGTVILDVIYNP